MKFLRDYLSNRKTVIEGDVAENLSNAPEVIEALKTRFDAIKRNVSFLDGEICEETGANPETDILKVIE